MRIYNDKNMQDSMQYCTERSQSHFTLQPLLEVGLYEIA